MGYKWAGMWALSIALSSMSTYGGTFEDNWNSEIREPRQLSQHQLNTLQARGVLFFGGILNELAGINSSYFTDSLEETEELGISSEYYGPWSNHSPSRNVDSLRAKIEERYLNEGKPLILVGHSKGGVELLYTILRYPELVLSGKVERVVLIQTPVQGTPLADEENTGWLLRWVSVPFREGLRYLGKKVATAILERHYREFQRKLEVTYGYLGKEAVRQKVKQVSEALFYVRSKHRNKTLSAGLSIVLAVVWDNLDSLGDNDGLVMSEDQKDPRFGTDLGVLTADHLTVVISGTFSNGTLTQRKAFTRALLFQLYPEL